MARSPHAKWSLVAVCATLTLAAALAVATTPERISYQGVLLNNNGTPVVTPVNVTFAIYADSTGGTALWSETVTNVTPNQNGVVAVDLGSVTPIPDTIFDEAERWLGVRVAPDPEFVPRSRLNTVPYAQRVASVDGAGGGAITGPLEITPGAAQKQVLGPDGELLSPTLLWLNAGTIRISDGNEALGRVLTSDAIGHAHWTPLPSAPNDMDWNRTPAGGPVLHPWNLPTDQVSIGTLAPAVGSKLHVHSPNIAAGPAQKITFATTAAGGSQGLDIVGTDPGFNAGVTGVQAMTRVSGVSVGDARGILAASSAFNLQSGFVGAQGVSGPETISNFGATSVTRGVGVQGIGDLTVFNNLSPGTGTFWLGGVIGELNGNIAASENLPACVGAMAAVIGVDNNTGTATTYAGYFAGDVAWTGVAGNCSDRRYKKNIKTIDGALDKVLALRGVNYDWRVEEFPDRRFKQGRQLGLIAQEVEPVIPEMVRKGAGDYYEVTYDRLIPVLVEAIKEQQAIIDEQHQALAAQGHELEALRGEMVATRTAVERLIVRVTEAGSEAGATITMVTAERPLVSKGGSQR